MHVIREGGERRETVKNTHQLTQDKDTLSGKSQLSTVHHGAKHSQTSRPYILTTVTDLGLVSPTSAVNCSTCMNSQPWLLQHAACIGPKGGADRSRDRIVAIFFAFVLDIFHYLVLLEISSISLPPTGLSLATSSFFTKAGK